MSNSDILSRTKNGQINVTDSITNTRANLLKLVMNNQKYQGKSEIKILVVGLSGAGKTTLMEFLDKGAIVLKTRKPTLAFTRYLIDFGKLKLYFIDAPGQQAYWREWDKYANSADGILFMIDSANFRDVVVINKLIYDVLKLQSREIPTLFMANKQDLESSINSESIRNLLKLRENVPSSAIFPIAAINGMGILEAFRWFLQEILKIDQDFR